MKQILFILLIPSLLMAGLGAYWLSMVRMLDGQRAEFVGTQRIKDHQQLIEGFLSGATRANNEQFVDALKKQQVMIEWERGYYEMLRDNMVGLGWIAAFIGLCQFAGVYCIHRRLRRLST